MSYFLLAAICAAVGVIPLLLARKFLAATLTAFGGLLVLWGLFYLFAVPFMSPYLGGVVFLTMVLWTVSAALANVMDDSSSKLTFMVPVGYAVLFLGSCVAGSGMVNAGSYASLIGPISDKTWTRDSQPKDPRHIRLIGNDTALYIAQKWVGSAGAIGSQFSLASDYITLQRIKGDMKYVVPLDFAGFSQWTSVSGVPAYLIIDAQDPYLEPKVVMLPEGQRFVYTPGAYFSDNLERHLRRNGFFTVGFAEVNFEIDDAGKAWWVVPTYERTIVWGGEKLHDVALVDPISGQIKRFALDQVPAWIDRVMPPSYVKDYLSYRGSYARGWLNSFWSQQGLTKPESTSLIYGMGNRLEWVTGITSDTSKDDSLVGIAYTDARTGHTTIYKVDGGATDEAVQQAVEANAYSRQYKLTAGVPQMYNIYGQMTAVVPLLNDVKAYQGTALVSVKDPQIIGVGLETENAGRQYQELLFRSGQQAIPGMSTKLATVKGVVDRIHQNVGPTGSPYLLHIGGVNRIFTASSQDPANVKLPLTQPGDRVEIEFISSGETVVPIKRFDNQSLTLDQTPIQAEVAAIANAKHVEADTRSTATDIRRRIGGMSDEEIVRTMGGK